MVLAVVDVGKDEESDDGPREELLGLETEGERLPTLLEGLERVAEAVGVVAEDLCGGEDAEVHLGGDADLEVDSEWLEWQEVAARRSLRQVYA